MMKLYMRLLSYLRPHLRQLILAIVFMTGFAAFSGGTVALVVPFSKIIFQGGDLPAGISALSESAGPSGGSSGWVASLQNTLKDSVYGALRGTDRVETLGRFCLLILFVFLMKNLFWYAQSFLIVRVEQGVIRDIRNRLFDRYLGLPVEYYNEARAGVLVSRITNDVNLVRGAIANGFAQGIRQSLLVVAYLTAVLLANWRLFLVTLVVAPPAFYAIGKIGKRLRRYSSRSQEKMADLTGVLQETIGGVRVVKAFNLQDHMRNRFHRVNQAFAGAMIRMTRTGSLAPPVTEILGASVGVLILYIGGRDIVRGTGMDAGQFLMFLVALFALMQPLRTLSSVNIQVQEGLAAAVRIFEILDTESVIQERPDPKMMPREITEIRFDSVSYSYSEGKPVLQGISFAVPAGKMVAIVGPSGAGKTTLVDLIPRFYDPREGAVRLNGIDVRDLRLADLRGAIGLVTQDTILFDESVFANIALGRPAASASEVEAAALAANADGFIRELADGYATQVGDRGVKLSGGQRQRIAIARAILKNPPILILDEATSALDSESESLVQEALERAVENRTTFVIAHRLSTVRRADLILVLEGGRISDTGRHEELIGRAGVYRRLYEMQFRGE